MKTQITLVSTPWADFFTPSIQLGALKAFLDAHPTPDVTVETRSAFAEILLDVLRAGTLRSFDFRERSAEHTYSLLLIKRYARVELEASGRTLGSLVESHNQGLSRGDPRRLTRRALDALERATVAYTERSFVFDARALNLVGFTLNYDQVTSALFIAKQIAERYPDTVFLFGGMSAADPASVELIRSFGPRAFGVLGEGEGKIKKMAEACAAAPNVEGLEAALVCIPGVYSFASPPGLWVKDKAAYREQVGDIAKLPVPDFTEYYQVLHRYYTDPAERAGAHRLVELPIEGTRGCFAKCSFCGLNYLWDGFRKMPSSQVAERARRYHERYPAYRFKFVDNVCDTWAEAYADDALEVGAATASFMELRAHHGEAFWTKLALSGVKSVQIGTEALTENMLRLISKGTTVAQNILAHKYLFELGVESSSNLITHYPGSTPRDAVETRAVLETLTHLPAYNITPFVLSMGSPIFERLSPEERAALVPRGAGKLPPELARFSLEYGYSMPDSMLDPETRRAWDDLATWFRTTYTKARAAHRGSLTCETLPDGRLRVSDERMAGRSLVREYDAEAQRVYTSCHAGPTLSALCKQVLVSEGRVRTIVGRFVEDGILVQCGGRLLALAVRSRDQLVRKPLERRSARAPELAKPSLAPPLAQLPAARRRLPVSLQ
jgi:radical SAM superfamily enzyme YgiQ (UPF0313 family)